MRRALFGYEVDSDLPLHRLSSTSRVRGSLSVRRCAPFHRTGAPVHEDVSSGSSFVIAREPDGSLVISCSLAGGFRLDPAGMRIEADANAEDAEVWEHRLVTVAVPLLLAEQGEVALHAAAIGDRGAAVAFAGRSGRGKSTLAHAAQQAGHAVLGDDAVVVERAAGGGLVWPGPRGQRVSLSAGSRKETVLGEDVGSEPLPLAAIALLGDRTAGATPEVYRIAPAQAVPRLLPSLVFAGSDRVAEAMRAAAWLAATVPVCECRLPEGIQRLPAALDAILPCVSAGVA